MLSRRVVTSRSHSSRLSCLGTSTLSTNRGQTTSWSCGCPSIQITITSISRTFLKFRNLIFKLRWKHSRPWKCIMLVSFRLSTLRQLSSSRSTDSCSSIPRRKSRHGTPITSRVTRRSRPFTKRKLRSWCMGSYFRRPSMARSTPSSMFQPCFQGARVSRCHFTGVPSTRISVLASGSLPITPMLTLVIGWYPKDRLTSTTPRTWRASEWSASGGPSTWMDQSSKILWLFVIRTPSASRTTVHLHWWVSLLCFYLQAKVPWSSTRATSGTTSQTWPTMRRLPSSSSNASKELTISQMHRTRPASTLLSICQTRQKMPSLARAASTESACTLNESPKHSHI